MDTVEVSPSRRLTNPNARLLSFKPKSYQDMDDWLNALSPQAWIAVVGAFALGGFPSVIEHIKQAHQSNLAKWRNKDLQHFFDSRKLEDFKTRHERSFTVRG